MLRKQRLPHGLLFHGPLGTGKYSLALALAQALNCENPGPDMSPCRKCRSCGKIAEGAHPDVITLTPKGKLNIIPIEYVRELREALSFQAYEGKYKVAIIRDAHRFRDDAGGALLKTLEEPTPDTVLILTAESPSRVLETLVSRCVRLKLSPLSRTQIMGALSQKGFELKASCVLAGLSGGALGVALGLDSETTLSIWGHVDRLLGIPERAKFLKAAIDWTNQIAAEVDKITKAEDDPRAKANFLGLIQNSIRLWWRDVTALAATADSAFLLGPPPSAAQKTWSRKVTARMVGGLETSMAKLSDGLNRSMRAALLFENYWLDVLEYF
jgi:DNA polymerase III delta' subunit